MAVKAPLEVYEMKYHIITPGTHTLGSSTLSFFTLSILLGELIRTGSKNEWEFKRKKHLRSPLAVHMLALQHPIIIAMSLFFTIFRVWPEHVEPWDCKCVAFLVQ